MHAASPSFNCSKHLSEEPAISRSAQCLSVGMHLDADAKALNDCLIQLAMQVVLRQDLQAHNNDLER